MLSKPIQDAISEQIKNELSAAHVYLSMSAYALSANLPGFSHWFRIQYQEEVAHAMKLFDYVYDRGGKVALQAIEKPPADYPSPIKAMQKALEYEQRNTAQIHKLYDLALKEKDVPTQVFMQWFVTEQVEEEKQATQVIEQLKLVGGQGSGLIILDKELGARQAEK